MDPEAWVEQAVVQQLLQQKIAGGKIFTKCSTAIRGVVACCFMLSLFSGNLLLVGQVTKYLVSLRKVLRRSAVRWSRLLFDNKCEITRNPRPAITWDKN